MELKLLLLDRLLDLELQLTLAIELTGMLLALDQKGLGLVKECVFY